MSANKQNLINKLAQARQRAASAQARVAELEVLVNGDDPQPPPSYSLILDNLIEGCQIIGFDWRYLYLNNAAATQAHQPQEALIGRTMQEMHPGIEASPMFEALKRCLEDRGSQQLENEVSDPNGTKRCFEISIQPVPEGACILSLDITGRKRTEVTLKHYAQRMGILHQIDMGIIQGRSIQATVETTLNHLRQLIPCRRANVVVINEELTEGVIFAVDFDGQTALGGGVRVPLKPSDFQGYDDQYTRIVAYRTWQAGNPVVKQLVDEGMVMGLQTLLMHQGHPIGALGLLADREDFFTPEHREIAVQIAGQLALAIHQLRLTADMAQQVEYLQQAEATLRLSEARYRSVVEDQTDLICRYDTDLRLTFVNQAYCDVYGVEADTALGGSFLDRIPVEHRELAVAHVQTLDAANPVATSEHQSLMPDGTQRWFQWTDHAILDDRGQVVEYQGVGRDVTDRKHLQLAQSQHINMVEEMQQFLQATLDAFPANTAVLDADGVIINFNTPWKRFADQNDGPSGTYYLGANYLSICDKATGVWSQEAQPVSAGIRAVIAGQQDDFYIEYPCHSPVTERWYGVRVTPFNEPAPRRVVVAHIDISERKQTEAALQESHATLELRVQERTSQLQASKEQVEAILNNSLDGILLLNTQNQIQRLNTAFSRLFACENNEYLDHSLFDLVHPNDVGRVRAVLEKDQDSQKIEFRAQRKDGSVFEAQLGIGFIKNAGCVCTIRDISEQKAQERQLRFFASLQHNLSDAVISADLDYRIQSWNKAAERIYGWTEAEVKGQVISDIFRTQYESEAQRQEILSSLRSPGWWQGEALQHHKDGSVIYIWGSVTLIKDAHGMPLGFVTVNHDITARKVAERTLLEKRHEEHEFQTYLEALHEITIELAQIHSQDEFYKRAVELGLEKFGFERLGLLLYDANRGLALGTYGTDPTGELRAEHHLEFDPHTPTGILSRTLNQEERFSFDEQTRLYSNMEFIGWGWNAAVALWKGTENLGWLAADNAVHHKPASKPLLDILGLYALTLSTLLLQKRGELALRESEARYRLLAENITDVIVRVTPEGIYRYVSPSCKAVLGYDPKAVLGTSLLDYIHPEDFPRLHRLRDTSMVQGTSIPITYRFRHQDGHYIWLEVVREYIRTEDGVDTQEFIASARDVTDRKTAEDALKESEIKFRQLLDAAPVATIIADQSGRISLVNLQAEALFGYQRAEMIGSSVDLLLPQAVLTEPQLVEMDPDVELFGRRKNGTEFPVEIQRSYIDTQAGMMMMSFVTDITERKRIAAELSRQTAFLRQVIDVSPSMIFVKDYDARFVLVNPIVAKMYETNVDDLIGKTDADFSPSSNQIADFMEADRKVINSGEPLYIEEPITAPSGETRWLQTTKVPIVGADNVTYVLGVSTDITERKNSEEALRQALEKEKELGELKSRFVSMASHEFRTPLATILALTETLMAYRHKLPDAQIEVRLTKIQDQIGHLKDIMEDVLLLARMQARRVEFSPAKLNLDALCRSVIDEFQSRPDVTHQFVYNCDAYLHEIILDKKLMRQIINNLVSNAVKYSPSSSPIKINLGHEANQLIFKVQDEGIGIPEADLKHLFEPFHRAANVGAISGTGLGMVITKESVELHGGAIAVASQVGTGTTFTVTIPLNEGGTS